EAAMAGNANPSNRLVELVVRARGVEEMAKDAGMIGFMITITCPSKYHANSYKWNMTNYKVAQEYLVKQFAKLRSALDYRGINIPGIRVAEPHKDGTPHWHMCTFIQPEHEETFKKLVTRYAFQVDGHEKGAKEKRLDIKPIDKRGAVGYVIKYLSKNIEGEFMQGELDLEANVEVSEGAKFARAWASRYHLRQFQFYGT
ncbi:replication endonuclease, partial [Shewanella sp. D64]